MSVLDIKRNDGEFVVEEFSKSSIDPKGTEPKAPRTAKTLKPTVGSIARFLDSLKGRGTNEFVSQNHALSEELRIIAAHQAMIQESSRGKIN